MHCSQSHIILALICLKKNLVSCISFCRYSYARLKVNSQTHFFRWLAFGWGLKRFEKVWERFGKGLENVGKMVANLFKPFQTLSPMRWKGLQTFSPMRWKGLQTFSNSFTNVFKHFTKRVQIYVH